MINRFVVFGASGDLTSRYLLTALADLHESRLLSADLQIAGVARDDWDTEDFRKHADEALVRHASHLSSTARQAVVSLLRYHKADVTNPDEVAGVIGSDVRPLVAYLALPPSLFGSAVRALGTAGVPEGSRIVIEKPFGENLTSARKLNRLLHENFAEEAVFRIDHFLHKQTVQNILGLRLANRIFEPLWNSQHIERVEIVWDETLALEGRASYYDSAGALKDMIQNHLLQLLCFVAMEPPITLGERDLRDRKIDVLRATRRLSSDEVEQMSIRGRYVEGSIDGRAVPAYVEEEGVDRTRETETFAELVLYIDNWRWAGVPFVLRTGKALAADRHEIAIRFRQVPHLAFGQEHEPIPNVLHLDLDTDAIALAMNVNGAGAPFDLEPLQLDASLAPHELPAYARLLLDVLEGDVTLSIRADEAEESWRVVEPILDAWSSGEMLLTDYAAGSHGPT